MYMYVNINVVVVDACVYMYVNINVVVDVCVCVGLRGRVCGFQGSQRHRRNGATASSCLHRSCRQETFRAQTSHHSRKWPVEEEALH